MNRHTIIVATITLLSIGLSGFGGTTTPAVADADRPERPSNSVEITMPGDTLLNAGGEPYNIEQAISDKAQGMTIAFDALAFLTGSLGADSFFPPGKVADFWVSNIYETTIRARWVMQASF